MTECAPALFSANVLSVLGTAYLRRWICRGGPVNWSVLSPDFSCLEFFLWTHMKSLVYAIHVDSDEALVARIAAGEMREKPRKKSLVYVARYNIHHIWHYRVRLRESGKPIGRLCKTCKNAFPHTIPVSFGRLDTSIATESSS
ncbi:uncharacterized protein TNCV_2949651 [Trichonephila clavipes]|nr:uncharacterized protein TNCV_2949651 [Trichonephila clavipes]